jgi:HK97 family phage portal protein
MVRLMAGVPVMPTVQQRYRTSPRNVPEAEASLVYQNKGRVGKANVALFRNWAEHSEWVRAAIGLRKAQVSAAQWDIVPIDPEKPYDRALQGRLTRGLHMPNPAWESWRSFIEPVVEDILVLDAGVIEKERTLGGQVAYLHWVDGGQVKVNALWDGEDPNEPRYWWSPGKYGSREVAAFKNSDMIYIMANPSTYRVVGLSPLETLKNTIDAEIAGHTYNSRQVTNAAPDGMLDLGEGARPEMVENFKSYWAAEIAGRGAMAFIGGSKNAKFVPFRSSNRDMQFLEWQKYLVRKIAAVFLMNAQDLQITDDVNRATAEVQQEQAEDRGLRPLLSLLQDYVTREYIWDTGFGGPDNNLCLAFRDLNLKESQARAQMAKALLSGLPSRTINEQRIADGKQPIDNEDFDELIAMTPLGIVKLKNIPDATEILTFKQKQPADGGGEPEDGDGEPPKPRRRATPKPRAEGDTEE